MSKYNLNKKKGTKYILLLLVLTFVAVPVIGAVMHLIFLFGS